MILVIYFVELLVLVNGFHRKETDSSFTEEEPLPGPKFPLLG